MDVTVKAYQELNDKILKEGKELDDGLNKLEEQLDKSERVKWKEELDRARNEIFWDFFVFLIE